MSPLVWIGVAGLGGVGAALRVALSGGLDRVGPAHLPSGTFVVNSVGSLLAGLAFGLMDPGDARTLVLVGLLGSLTTFSTWAVQTHNLATAGRRLAAVANVAAGAGIGLAAAEVGRLLAG